MGVSVDKFLPNSKASIPCFFAPPLFTVYIAKATMVN